MNDRGIRRTQRGGASDFLGLSRPSKFTNLEPPLGSEIRSRTQPANSSELRNQDARSAAGLPPVLTEPRQDLDEVAGGVPDIELVLQDAVPRVAAGAW